MVKSLVKRFFSSLPLRAWLLGTLVSLAAAMALHRYEVLEATNNVADQAAAFEARLGARIEAYMALLRGGIGLFATLPELTREEFHRYVEQVGPEQNYPGIQGIGVSMRVAPEQVTDVVTGAHRSGVPSFRIWPEGARPEYFTILYLEPQDARNRAALGFDMYTDPARRGAMDRARQSGQPAATGRVTLVQEIDALKQPGFLIYVPFYRGATWPRTEAERVNELVGYVYAAFQVGDLVAAVKKPEGADDVSIRIEDGLGRGDASQLYASTPVQSRRRSVVQTRILRVVDQTWTLVYGAGPVSLFPPVTLFLLGFIASGGVAFILRRERRERRRAERSEAETLEREGELALLIEAVPAVVSFIDRDGIFRMSNRRYEEWFELHPRVMLGRPMRDVLGAESYAEIEPYVRRALRGEPVAFERWQHFGRAGTRYLSTFFVPHRNRRGEFNGFYSLVSDLTSLKRAEEIARFIADCGKLLTSSLDYESTARGIVHLAVPRVADFAAWFRVQDDYLIPAAVAQTNAGDTALAAHAAQFKLSLGGMNNIAAAARSGMVVINSDVTAANLDQIVSSPDQGEFLRSLRIISAMHVPVVVRGKIWGVFSFASSSASGRRFTDQQRQLAEEISTRVRIAVENAMLHAEAKQEIEERRRAERIVAETEERFRLLVTGARDYAIILLDPDGAVASWNEGAERILGFGEAEAVGMPIDRLYLPEDYAAGAPQDELARTRDTGSALEERWYVRKNGTRFWASGHTLVLRTAEGLIRGYAKIMRDLTERKLTEDELEHRVQQRTLELNEAVQELEAFSYSVSHDLRAPLRSIRGFTELALEEAADRLTDVEKGYLNRVERAVARLDQLISDLLAYTRVSKTRVELAPINLHALLSDLLREHPEFQLPLADAAIDGKLDAVIGNTAYLTQCLTNLMGNAVKFVKGGQTPKVRIWTERRGAMVRLHVRDNGIGIPRDSVARVFEMFERLHPSDTYEGTGVGLAIVRRAVHRMNGSIGLDSVEGVGTTFWIELAAASETMDGASAAAFPI